ncbi:hypothetical protein HGM15179_006693 [Zosterops borbonicus]|uniref:Retroviral nucleocapsid Gag protein p24 C-terminal domain-containing protein n=1 Tax=Zosterops borbonicus TaxID=364589 RepID=A0A8K1GLY6_9PASS|nr:hypothetical protein HGM15179_006693 [Zosterops borbonicus]
MFAMGKENLVHIGYNGQKCSFVGDTEYLMWYNISFIRENTVFCSPQIVASQYVSFHKDRLKDFQAPRLLCCANISFHEVGLLAETVNQCRPKTPPRENPFTFKPEPEEEEWDSGNGTPRAPTLAPVTYRRGRGGHEEAKWQQLSQNVIRDLMKAFKEYGRTSPYFLGLLDGQITGSEVVPHDIKHLFRCLHSRTEYQLWFATWKRCLQDALPGLLEDSDTGVDNEGNLITLSHLLGEGDWEMPQKQAESLPKPLIKKIAQLAVKAFSTMKPSGLMESYLDIFQGPQENFLLFVERLTIAIEQQEEDEAARQQLVTSLAFKHANQVCKQAMLTLPRKPKPSLQDYIEVVTEVVPLMAPTKADKPEQKKKSINTVETSAQPDNTVAAPKTPKTP